MADQDYTQDKGFMSASPEDQHAYLMHADQGYAKASPDEQKAFIAHLRTPATATPNTEPKANDEGLFKKALGTVSGAADTLREGQTGVLKGAAHTLTNVGDWFGKGVGNPKDLANRISEGPAPQTIKPDQHQAMLGSVKKWSQPTTLPEKVGFGGEQAAEFMLPERAVAKGAKVARTCRTSLTTLPSRIIIGLGCLIRRFETCRPSRVKPCQRLRPHLVREIHTHRGRELESRLCKSAAQFFRNGTRSRCLSLRRSCEARRQSQSEIPCDRPSAKT
jgi:hypothetical protein